jgi:hypothetical protein
MESQSDKPTTEYNTQDIVIVSNRETTINGLPTNPFSRVASMLWYLFVHAANGFKKIFTAQYKTQQLFDAAIHRQFVLRAPYHLTPKDAEKLLKVRFVVAIHEMSQTFFAFRDNVSHQTSRFPQDLLMSTFPSYGEACVLFANAKGWPDFDDASFREAQLLKVEKLVLTDTTKPVDIESNKRKTVLNTDVMPGKIARARSI